MPFQRGKPRPPNAGRKKGTPNKVSKSAKEAYVEVFERLGGADGLFTWARQDPGNLRDFYNWHSNKLIPTEKDVRVEIGDAEKLKTMSLEELEAMAKAAGLDL